MSLSSPDGAKFFTFPVFQLEDANASSGLGMLHPGASRDREKVLVYGLERSVHEKPAMSGTTEEVPGPRASVTSGVVERHMTALPKVVVVDTPDSQHLTGTLPPWPSRQS